MTHPKSFSPIGFFRLQALHNAGVTVVESDYAGIAPCSSTLHTKTLAYEFTPVSSSTFSYRVYRLDPEDEKPVNVDLYTLTLVGSAARRKGPTELSSGHHLHDLPAHIWESLPAPSPYLDVAATTILISSSVSPYSS